MGRKEQEPSTHLVENLEFSHAAHVTQNKKVVINQVWSGIADPVYHAGM